MKDILENLKLFSPEDILKVFKFYFYFSHVPNVKIPKYSQLGEVKLRNFSIITTEDGTTDYKFELHLKTKE